jgi:YYY domain-containing protein
LVRNRFLLDPEFLAPSGISPMTIWIRSVIVSPVWTALGLFALLVAIVFTLNRSLGGESRASSIEPRDFILLLFATGVLLTLSVEYVYLKDHFLVRMNTVFKFYFQAWVLWGVAGAYALAGFIRRGGVVRTAVSAVAVLLIIIGLIYPGLAIPKRAAEHGGPPTLDGAAHLAQTHADDYAAITWLNENVDGAPVILEFTGGSYSYAGRVSAHTGLPTVLGWAGHERQWRGEYEEQGQRGPDIETLYTSVDENEVLTLLDKYGISYVYVGPEERSRYPAAGLVKFSGLMETVYDTGTVTIYRR